MALGQHELDCGAGARNVVGELSERIIVARCHKMIGEVPTRTIVARFQVPR